MNGLSLEKTDFQPACDAVKLLMVEDDDYYYKMMCSVLNGSTTKFEVIRKSCLAEALVYLSVTAPDVILLDLNLPDSRGLSTLQGIQSCSLSAPIIVLTGTEGQEMGINSIKNGADDFLVKQKVGTDSILRCISYAIERRKSEQSRLRLLAIQDFTAALAHDLQAPLIGAEHVLDILLSDRKSQLSEDQFHLLGALKESNTKQLTLVQKLIEIYRYESGHETFAMESLDMKTVILNFLPEAEVLAKKKDIQIRANIADDLRLINADVAAMRSLLSSLLDNAIKFGTNESIVELSAKNVGTGITLSVKNFGEVIAPENQLRLFDRFWQGMPGKTYVANTGFGLYRCQRIATAHNGKIECISSSEEGGTTFSVSIPGISMKR